MEKFAATGTGQTVLNPMANLAGRLGFAASPTFALMAFMSAFGSPGIVMCGPASPLVPISDMTLMYVLMSLFHLPPWLKLLTLRSRHPLTPI